MYLCHRTHAETNIIDSTACINSHEITLVMCVWLNSSLPFLMHNIPSQNIMAQYVQH